MEQTRVTEELLQEVLRSIDEGIHVVDVEGITIFYNHVAATLDGMSVEGFWEPMCWRRFPRSPARRAR